jgi:hypothetical protein
MNVSVGELRSVERGSEELDTRRRELVVRMYEEFENQGARVWRVV